MSTERRKRGCLAENCFTASVVSADFRTGRYPLSIAHFAVTSFDVKYLTNSQAARSFWGSDLKRQMFAPYITVTGFTPLSCGMIARSQSNLPPIWRSVSAWEALVPRAKV